jgi:hypothetical protein
MSLDTPCRYVWAVENKTSFALFATEDHAKGYVSAFSASVAGGMSITKLPVFGGHGSETNAIDLKMPKYPDECAAGQNLGSNDKRMSAHDHGNCELCDQLERELADARAIAEAYAGSTPVSAIKESITIPLKGFNEWAGMWVVCDPDAKEKLDAEKSKTCADSAGRKPEPEFPDDLGPGGCNERLPRMT